MTGLLLCNLGTPDQPSPGAVRRYLRQFLGDPRVLDLHPVGRWALLNLVILPWRPPQDQLVDNTASGSACVVSNTCFMIANTLSRSRST